MRANCSLEEPLVLAGDYNVMPEARDAAHPEQWTNDALFLPPTRGKFSEFLALGLADALRATTDAGGPLYFLGLSGGRLAAEQRHPHRPPAAVAPGRRHPENASTIDKAMRGRDKASDHVPVRIELAA